jgi:hypothetical protein
MGWQTPFPRQSKEHPMTDWADKIADILEYGGSERDTVSSVAQELRKAKADGMRAAKEICINELEWPGYSYVRLRKAIDNCADEIERGPTP